MLLIFIGLNDIVISIYFWGEPMRFVMPKFFPVRMLLSLILLLAVSVSLIGCQNNPGTVKEPGGSTPIFTEPSSQTTAAPSLSPSPTPTPTPEPTVQPPSPEAPVVALTFDDGPSLRDTGRLLDLLAEEDVTVTFLVLGTQVASGREELLKRAFDEGHEIGNHSYSHAIFTGLKADEIRNELEKTNDLIESVTGSRPTIMRPPTGAYNDDVVSVCSDLGLAVINWSWQSCPEDWNHHDNPDHIAEHVIANAQNGHIVLLHDTNEASVNAMPRMIAGLKERGFRFMTVSQMLSFLGEDHPQPGQVYHYMTLPSS